MQDIQGRTFLATPLNLPTLILIVTHLPLQPYRDPGIGQVSSRTSRNFCEQLRWGDVEAVGELDDDVKGRVSAAALQSADVGPVEPDVVGESLL